jgi:ubiquitin C-terminal hydrolase
LYVHREKIDALVDFPIDGLDLAPYCAKGSSHNDKGTIYDLFAINNHYGRMGFGHYTSVARDWMDMYKHGNMDKGEDGEGIDIDLGGDEWYSYDDNDVTKISQKEVKTRAAYILFYRRRPNPQT